MHYSRVFFFLFSMRFFLTFLLAFTFLQCNNQGKNEVSVFNNINFHLKPNESVENITQSTVALYDSLFNGQFSEIPLYKKIRHQQYSLFLGLPFNTNLKKLKSQKYERPDSVIISKAANDSCFIINYRIDKTFATEYAIQIDQNSLMFLSGLTTKQAIADSLLTLENLTERFVIK